MNPTSSMSLSSFTQDNYQYEMPTDTENEKCEAELRKRKQALLEEIESYEDDGT